MWFSSARHSPQATSNNRILSRLRPRVEQLEDRLAPAFGDPLSTLVNQAPGGTDFFGKSVAISGNLAVVGSPGDNTGGTAAGIAFLYDITTGNWLRTFNNPTPENFDTFGSAVAIDGNRVLIGAPGDNTGAGGAGSAYLIDANTGAVLQTFNNPDPDASDIFGASVALSGNLVLIGAPNNNSGATQSGSAYLFNASNSLLKTFDNPTPGIYELFGYSVAVSANHVLIGSPVDGEAGAGTPGAAYLFSTTTPYLRLRTFVPPEPVGLDTFGVSVAISGNRFLVGANGNSSTGLDSGAAYLFGPSNDQPLRTFNNPNANAGGRFGQSVSLAGDSVLIGAPKASVNGTLEAGVAYLFNNVLPFSNPEVFLNPGPEMWEGFGFAVATTGSAIVIGAPGVPGSGFPGPGPAYVLDGRSTVEFLTASSSGSEATTTGTLTVTLTPASALPVTVNYNVTGTATGGGTDFTIASGPLTFAPGEPTKTIAFTVNNDQLNEPNESFTVTLSTPTNATLGAKTTHTYTIQDDGDAEPFVQFLKPKSKSLESITAVSIPVKLSAASGFTVTVAYTIGIGTATGNDVDFTLANGTVTFSPGTLTKNIDIAVINDLFDEPNETIKLTLSNPVKATLGATKLLAHTYSITDDDLPPTVEFEVPASEGQDTASPVTINVKLSAESGRTVTVNFSIYKVGATATPDVDFALEKGTLTFSPGETMKQISLTIFDDLDTIDETVLIKLSAPKFAKFGTNKLYTYTIKPSV